MEKEKIMAMLHSDGYHDAENYVQSLEARLEQAEQHLVIECCPHCESEIEMRWDVAVRGYKAFCPVCGQRLMLCDECLHSDDGEYTGRCDYCSETDSCYRNPARQPETNNLDELDFLRSFIRESCFDVEVLRDQLRALWTAFCLRRNYDVDTLQYDTTLRELWNVLQETGDGTADWSDFDSFDNFMCVYLV